MFDIMDKIVGIYSARYRITKFLFGLFVSILISLGFIPLVLTKAKDVTVFELSLLLTAWSLFFSLLFYVIDILENKQKKIKLFQDGIEIQNQKTGKRVKIKWHEISSIKLQREFLGNRYLITTSDRDILGIVPFPLKEMNEFLNSLKEILGDQHFFVKELLKKRT